MEVNAETEVKLSLQSISNVKMEGAVWQQATLPSSMGGLGVRKSVDLALPAFLSSAHASQDLITSILPLGEPSVEALSCEAADRWKSDFAAHYHLWSPGGNNVHGIQALWRPCRTSSIIPPMIQWLKLTSFVCPLKRLEHG